MRPGPARSARPAGGLRDLRRARVADQRVDLGRRVVGRRAPAASAPDSRCAGARGASGARPRGARPARRARARVNGRGEPAMKSADEPLSNRRSSRRKSLPDVGVDAAISASILPAQSSASAVGQRGAAPSPGTIRRGDRREAPRARRPRAARAAPRGARPRRVERNANGSAPAQTSSRRRSGRGAGTGGSRAQRRSDGGTR